MSQPPRNDNPTDYLNSLPLKTRLEKTTHLLHKLEAHLEATREIRDKTIADMHALGFTLQELSHMLHISPSRIKQILDADDNLAPNQEPHAIYTAWNETHNPSPADVGTPPHPKTKAPQGMYLGYTTTTPTPLPVFYDPHSAIRNDRPPVTLIAGSPGSGKSFASRIIAAHSRPGGETSVIIDCANDYSGLIEWNHITVDQYKGLLNPFQVLHDGDATKTATIYRFVAKLFGEPITEKASNEIVGEILAVAETPRPGLDLLAERLAHSPNHNTQIVGEKLLSCLKIPESAPLFGYEQPNPTKNPRKTVYHLHNYHLHLVDRPRTVTETLGEIVAELCLHKTASGLIPTDRKSPSGLIVLDGMPFTDDISKTFAMLARMSRACDTAIVVATYDPLNFLNPTRLLDMTVSTVFAFRSVKPIAEQMSRLLVGDDSLTDTIGNLRTGECVMKDEQGLLGQVLFVIPDSMLD